MADVDTAARDCFCNTFCAATEDIAKGLSTGRACSADGHWTNWANFCSRVALDPLLIGYKEHVPILNIFARDYRTGDITTTSSPVRSRTAEDAVQSIGQVLAALGLANPRYWKDGKIDIRLRFQLRFYTKQDPPPNQVKPVFIIVLWKVAAVALATNDEETQCVCEMIIVAYFPSCALASTQGQNKVVTLSACATSHSTVDEPSSITSQTNKTYAPQPW